jgi:hypothetical protein
VRGASTGFIEPAFVSDQPIYVIRPQCKSSDSDILITVDATDDQKGTIRTASVPNYLSHICLDVHVSRRVLVYGYMPI